MNKQEQYRELLLQLSGLIQGESDETSVMANTAALIHHTFHFWWTGFYRVVNNELLLGAFQGPVACYHIAHGRGVCGTAWAERRTLAVPDVEQFAGHIACSSESRSEIVVPIYNKVGDVVAVLDIDSEHLNTFDATDQEYLEQVCQLISNTIYQ
ncbi:MAG: GAF domain-containing protein [Prevotella sp.]|nr:GAF domain-containing protein [Prevotella sp.]